MAHCSKAFIDFETTMSRGRNFLSEYGADKHCKAERATWIAWAIDNEPVQCERWSGVVEGNFAHDLAAADILVAHNMTFDAACMQHYMSPVNWAKVCDKRFACTETMSRRLKLPAKLKEVCPLLGIGDKLDMPMQIADDDEWREYNSLDVELCRKLYAHLRRGVSDDEMRVIHTHIKMMRHGITLDVDRLDDAIDQAAAERERVRKKFHILVGFNPRQPAAAEWMHERVGIKTTSMKKLGNLDKSTLPDDACNAMKLLTEYNDSEVDKLKAMKRHVSDDDNRLRNTLLCASTITHRWAGRGAHLHNCKRGGIARSLVVPSPGKKFFIADFSQVEVRCGLWYPGMLDACKSIHESDWYMDLAREIYGDAATREHRQMVKPAVIGSMYAGGAKTLAESLGGDLDVAEHLHRRSNELMEPIVDLSKRIHRTAMEVVRDGGKQVVPLHSGYELKMRMHRGSLMIKLPYREIILYYHDAAIRSFGNRTVITYKKAGVADEIKHRGDLYEHVCSSLCREFLAEAMVNVWHSDIQALPLYTIHDEIIFEIDDVPGIGEAILDVMRSSGEGLAGLMLDAEGHVADRWTKG